MLDSISRIRGTGGGRKGEVRGSEREAELQKFY